MLTQAAFDKLLQHLDADRDRAGEMYETIRHKLVKFFEWRGSRTPDDHADETLNRVARKIDEGEVIQNFQSYCYGVARFLFKEELKTREKEQAAVEQLPPPVVRLEQETEADTQLGCFERCLDSLPSAERELIVGYYQQEKSSKIENRKALAERYDLPLNALRIRTHRIRARLEACVEKCVEAA